MIQKNRMQPNHPASARLLLLIVMALCLTLGAFTLASTLNGGPGPGHPIGYLEPGWRCPEPENQSEPQNEAERLERERRARYRNLLPLYFELVPPERDEVLLMPVQGVRVRQVADTWGGLRPGGRLHEGQDIFAPAGTPIYSATPGYIYRIATTPVGGHVVFVIGGGGIRYYYAHLQQFAAGLEEGMQVTPETRLGYVGNTGNARTTPPHLHLGMYGGEQRECEWRAEDPLPLLIDR